MIALDAVAAVLLVLVVPLLAIAVRRRLLQRHGGTVEVSLRLRTLTRGGGWVLGVGRFAGDDLQWYRVFSLAPGPRRTLSRRDLVVLGRRAPVGGERARAARRGRGAGVPGRRRAGRAGHRQRRGDRLPRLAGGPPTGRNAPAVT